MLSLDPDLENMVMLDTGAGSNLIGSKWLDHYTDSLPKPNHLWASQQPLTTNFKGVGGDAQSTST
eukprot:5107154-Heterocapsa_arctica.AAC.1